MWSMTRMENIVREHASPKDICKWSCKNNTIYPMASNLLETNKLTKITKINDNLCKFLRKRTCVCNMQLFCNCKWY